MTDTTAEVKRGLMGDNVFVLTLIIGSVLLVATLGIILNILIRDGENVTQELNFLEGLVGGGIGFLGLLQAFHVWLLSKQKSVT